MSIGTSWGAVGGRPRGLAYLTGRTNMRLRGGGRNTGTGEAPGMVLDDHGAFSFTKERFHLMDPIPLPPESFFRGLKKSRAWLYSMTEYNDVFRATKRVHEQPYMLQSHSIPLNRSDGDGDGAGVAAQRSAGRKEEEVSCYSPLMKLLATRAKDSNKVVRSESDWFASSQQVVRNLCASMEEWLTTIMRDVIRSLSCLWDNLCCM
uniref:Uncharacterized protein n=1 Tax=Guillardia theta TaxID=55529 RepID=A0A7S4JQ06_GUITH|mmetsp:Transcript_17928/g.58890  ORF Transcript_17928/g.58890 Transcript_17928/m.58890 type:complete len:205 (+) Transcript_17928:164-778(+)